MLSGWKRHAKWIAALFALYLLIYYWPVIENAGSVLFYALAPLVVGALGAYIINLPMSFLERAIFGKCKSAAALKIKRPVCIVLSVLILVAVIFLIVTLIVPELVSCIELLLEELPPILESFYKNIDEQFGISEMFRENVNYQFGEKLDWEIIAEKALNFIISGFGGVMGSLKAVFSAIFSTIFTVFISSVFAIYMLAGKEKLTAQVKTLISVYIKPSIGKAVFNVIGIANETFRKFITGQCIEAVILGVLCVLGMSIFRFPYATMIGALVGFTALIPVAGAYIGAAIGAFMVFTADSFIKAVLFIVFIVILQQIEGNLIYPRVVGASIGLPGIWVLAAITAGGGLWGIPGMLIAVPLTATIYKLIRNDIQEKTSITASVKTQNSSAAEEQISPETSTSQEA